MRVVFYVAVAVAILARNNVVDAFTNADEFRIMSETTPAIATNAMISGDPRKRFLRVTDPADEDLMDAGEERGGKFGSLKEILAKLDEQDLSHVAEILKDVEAIHAKKALKVARDHGNLSKEDYDAAKVLLSLSKKETRALRTTSQERS
ncbi:Avirulence protein (Avh) [Phytophthora palmivora]|uniref:RxLR effector protein n=1 Tax=Phytophthora palmivora TaxID=4796 RepID=A0A2P4Y257_9STRA|nr:Avirulence protein (Avh) [Phytophthora palmivora]